MERFSHPEISPRGIPGRMIPPSLDQVLVGSVERSKSHEIRALYILGANDGVFPADGGEEGILLDREREALNHAGMELASDTELRLLMSNSLSTGL